jgi:hypothetical protein
MLIESVFRVPPDPLLGLPPSGVGTPKRTELHSVRQEVKANGPGKGLLTLLLHHWVWVMRTVRAVGGRVACALLPSLWWPFARSVVLGDSRSFWSWRV